MKRQATEKGPAETATFRAESAAGLRRHLEQAEMAVGLVLGTYADVDALRANAPRLGDLLDAIKKAQAILDTVE